MFSLSVSCLNHYEVYVCGGGRAQGCILYLLHSIQEASEQPRAFVSR